MKRIKLLKRSKGFTLTECLVAMGVFALMAALVMQILAVSIAQHAKNNRVEKDMDAQIQNIVDENALVERETTSLAMNFVKGGAAGSGTNVTISGVSVKQDGDGSDNNERLEINTLDASITPSDSPGDKEEGGAGMVTSDIHLYGTKGIKKVIVTQSKCLLVDGVYQMQIDFSIETPESMLSEAESCAIKVALPESSKNIVVTPDTNMTYSMLTSTRVRFSDKSFSSKETAYTMHITFTLAEDKFNSEYKSFAKYFIKSDSELMDTSATFSDTNTPGIYNTKL